jgi:hypothetical protein
VRKTAEDKSMQAERPGKVRRSVLLPAGNSAVRIEKCNQLAAKLASSEVNSPSGLVTGNRSFVLKA